MLLQLLERLYGGDLDLRHKKYWSLNSFCHWNFKKSNANEIFNSEIRLKYIYHFSFQNSFNITTWAWWHRPPKLDPKFLNYIDHLNFCLLWWCQKHHKIWESRFRCWSSYHRYCRYGTRSQITSHLVHTSVGWLLIFFQYQVDHLSINF